MYLAHISEDKTRDQRAESVGSFKRYGKACR